MNLEGFIC